MTPTLIHFHLTYRSPAADELAQMATDAVKAGCFRLAWEAIERMANLDWERAERAAETWARLYRETP